MYSATKLKVAARARFDSVSQKAIALSHRIHAHPELGFEERQASQWLCELLSDQGFKVEAGACGLPTAFVARAGSGPLHLAICAEYDSLPGIGHACGHNIIAAAAAGAGIAASEVAGDLGLTLSVIGTPAEEVGNASGKIMLLERGAFDGIHAAAMVHPAPIDMLAPQTIATAVFDVHYTGKEAYAPAFGQDGINAADAITVAQTAIGLVRQQIRPTDRIHGIVTSGGYERVFVPAFASARYMVRAKTVSHLNEIRAKVYRCFKAGAIATGAKLEIRGGDQPYAEMIHDPEMSVCYRRNAEALGRYFADLQGMDRIAVSTDMGNISMVIPSIHPMIGINCLPAMNHEAGFTACCISQAADKAVIDGSLAMAWTFIDLAIDSKVRGRLMGPKPAYREPVRAGSPQ